MQEVLGAVDLRRLGQHGRAAVAHQFVRRHAQRRVGGDAAVAVGAAAVGAEDEVRSRWRVRRTSLACGSSSAAIFITALDRLADAAAVLDRQDRRLHGAGPR